MADASNREPIMPGFVLELDLVGASRTRTGLGSLEVLMESFIHIKSTKFPRLPEEDSELVNEGTYGKALANYVQTELLERGYDAPFVCCEDWGWWVELRTAPFPFGVCVYSRPVDDEPSEFACTDGAVGDRRWSWKRLRFIDTTPWTRKLHQDLVNVFEEDQDVELVGTTDQFPF